MVNKWLKCLRKVNILISKILKEKQNRHYDRILVPEDNGKPNSNDSFTKKYQKHVAYSYGYKSVQFDDKFSKPFKSYLGEDAVYNFISSMIKVNIVVMW